MLCWAVDCFLVVLPPLNVTGINLHACGAATGPTDVRMTTRFKADNLMEGLTGAVHECGHSMYEQGRNMTPEFEGVCLSLHHFPLLC